MARQLREGKRFEAQSESCQPESCSGTSCPGHTRKKLESLKQNSAASASEAPAIAADNYELADTLGSYSSLYLQESALPPHRDLAPLARLLRRLHGVPAPAR